MACSQAPAQATASDPSRASRRVIEEIFGDKSRVCTGARGGPAFWQSQARPITVPGEKWKGQPLPGCTQPECWLPSSPSAAGEPTTVTIFGMSYCGHSMRAATNLFSLVENRPDKYRGRVFWGDQGGMVSEGGCCQCLQHPQCTCTLTACANTPAPAPAPSPAPAPTQDAPVSLPKESLKDRLTQFCQSKGCGYSRQTHPTFPIVFIGDKFVGGNSVRDEHRGIDGWTTSVWSDI